MIENIDVNLRPIRNPAHALREADDDWTVLVNLDSAAAVALNHTGLMLWQKVNGTATIEEIIEDVKKCFSDVPPEAEEDMLAVLQTLMDTGLIGFEVKV